MSTPSNRSTWRSRALRPWRTAAALAALVVAGALGACSDAPLGPTLAGAGAVPSLAKGTNGNGNGASRPGAANDAADTVWAGEEFATPVVASGLKRLEPLADTVSATFTVTRDGGTFVLPGTGLEIRVQKNTVKSDFELTVKALPGEAVAYEFGPHGTQFKKSLIMSQDLAGTDYASNPGAALDAGYFASLDDLDAKKGTALVKEALQNSIDETTGKFYFAVNHFSGYMVAWGFCDHWDRWD